MRRLVFASLTRYSVGMNYHVAGGRKLSGEVTTNRSKNAAVALLAASLLNKGTTTLKKMPRIEEVKRLIEVLQSIGVTVVWDENGDIHVTPEKINLEKKNKRTAGKNPCHRTFHRTACTYLSCVRTSGSR